MNLKKNRKQLSQENVYWSLCFHLYCKGTLHKPDDGSTGGKCVNLIQL